jgi:hypothetical protein
MEISGNAAMKLIDNKLQTPSRLINYGGVIVLLFNVIFFIWRCKINK